MHVTLTQGPETQTNIALTHLKTLKEAGFSDAALAMRVLDEEHVNHLIESNPDEWKPIEVTRTSMGDVIVDGYHRYEAAKFLKRTQIAAIYKNYSDEKAVIDAAFKANLKHGLPANDETRIMYAMWLMHVFNYSQSKAAKQAGIHQSTVSRYIQKLDKEQQEVQGDSSDQTSYNTHQVNYTKKLIKALADFYDNETAFLRSKGSDRSEEKRAKSLATAVNKDPEIVQVLQSMARTFHLAASLVEQKLPKQQKKA